MNTKDSVSYLFVIGMVFSLLWFFTGFWIGLGISILISVVFLIRTASISQAIPSSLTSKIPNIPNIKTIFYGLFWLAVIIFVLLFGWESFSYINCLGAEKFSYDTTMKDYVYGGNFIIQDEALRICGNATVFNSDASDEFFGIPLYWEHPDFDIFGTGKGKIKIIMDNGIQKYEEEFSVDGSFKIDFGTGSDYEREDIVYLKVNDKSLTIDKDPVYLDTCRPYSVMIYFNGTITVFEINTGE